VYDSEQITGTIQPLTGRKRGLLAVRVASGAPKEKDHGSAWAGASAGRSS